MNRFKMTGSANSMVHGCIGQLEPTNYFGYSGEFEKLSRKADKAQNIPNTPNRGMKPKA